VPAPVRFCLARAPTQLSAERFPDKRSGDRQQPDARQRASPRRRTSEMELVQYKPESCGARRRAAATRRARAPALPPVSVPAARASHLARCRCNGTWVPRGSRTAAGEPKTTNDARCSAHHRHIVASACNGRHRSPRPRLAAPHLRGAPPGGASTDKAGAPPRAARRAVPRRATRGASPNVSFRQRCVTEDMAAW
jgi:hypothetical protein